MTHTTTPILDGPAAGREVDLKPGQRCYVYRQPLPQWEGWQTSLYRLVATDDGMALCYAGEAGG